MSPLKAFSGMGKYLGFYLENIESIKSNTRVKIININYIKCKFIYSVEAFNRARIRHR